MMFKILVLQKLYNISDEQTEFQILVLLINFLPYLTNNLNLKISLQKQDALLMHLLLKFHARETQEIITRFSITAANIHDSIEIDKLIDENDKEL